MFYLKGRECALLQENGAQISYHVHALHGEGFLHWPMLMGKLQGAQVARSSLECGTQKRER